MKQLGTQVKERLSFSYFFQKLNIIAVYVIKVHIHNNHLKKTRGKNESSPLAI